MNSVAKKFLVVLFAVVLLLWQNTTVQAEEFNGYSVSQMIIKTKGKQGEKINHSLEVYNNTDKTSVVKVDVRDFDLKDKQVHYPKDRPASLSVMKWSTVLNKEFKLAPRQSQKITVDINIPKEAEMGEQVALLGVSFQPEGAAGNVKVATEILPVFYVTVTDQNGNVNLQKAWELIDFQADKVNGGSVQFQVKNTGNVHLESTGSMTIRNMITGREEKKDIPVVNLLPKAEKTIIVDWAPLDSIGVYSVDIQFSMDGERIEAKDLTFWVLPGTPILIGAGGLVLVIVLTRVYMVRLKRKMLLQAKQQVMAEMAPTSENSNLAEKE